MKKNIKHKSHISSHQFFVLFCLCFFSPSMVFLPTLMSSSAGTAAWICPLLGCFVFVGLFFLLRQIFEVQGTGFAQKTQSILGKTMRLWISLLVMIWCVVLSAFFARHFAERVLLVYLSDTTIVFIIVSLMAVVLISILGGMLSYARLCEMLFYFFVVLFLAVTILGMFDGMKLSNLMPISIRDSGDIIYGTLFMFFPFSVIIYMSLFGERVNFDNKILLRQGIKSSVLVSICTSLVLVLTIGQLGVFGVNYLQLPYFSVTRQIAFLGPLKNIGAIVFSLWILADFALVATLAYTASSIGQNLLNNKRRTVPAYIVVSAVTLISLFAFRDMEHLDKFLHTVVLPTSFVTSIGLPLLLFVVGLFKKKTAKSKETKGEN